MNWDIVIGLEVHIQLKTQSKIFSPAPITFCDNANTQVREVDAGLPGALPVLNREAVRQAVLFGLAISAQVNKRSEFARKNYFYPDLPKGYQISQYEYPIVSNGEIWIGKEEQKRIGITRAHLEEDAGKLVHDRWQQCSGVDLNRAGTALLEVVSEPELCSIKDAVLYAIEIHKIACWLDVCDGNMQEGSFRIDANVSVNRPGEKMGTRCEIKNLNSFRFLEQALNHEYHRQIAQIEKGIAIIQETRLFNPDTGHTHSMRSKENAEDYRYFPDPDLPPLILSEDYIDSIRQTLPELPQQRQSRLIETFALSPYDATLICAEKTFSDYFEAVLNHFSPMTSEIAKLCVNWLCGDFISLKNESKINLSECKISPEQFAKLMSLLKENIISGKIAKEVLSVMWNTGEECQIVIEKLGLKQINDEDELEKIAADIVTKHPKQVQQYKEGKEKLMGFFIGQLMKMTKGQANPEIANTLFVRLLK